MKYNVYKYLLLSILMDISIFEEKPSINDIDLKDKYFTNLVNFDINSMPNFIFYGNKGSGKTTKIYAFLCSLLDKKVYTLKNVEVEVEKKIFKFRSSIYHLEIDILELINNERIFFHNYLKSYCETRNIGLDIPKIILLLNVDKINRNSLLMLRKLIESTYQSAKYIFETNSISNIPETLSTRFLSFRVKNPNREEIEKMLKNIIKKNKIKITKTNLNKIINFDIDYNINYNLNNIILALNYYVKTKKILTNNYHKIICDLVNIILDKNLDFNNISKLKLICEKIFINCYDVNELVISINDTLCNKFKNNNELCFKIIKLSCECDINLVNSTGKYFIHLENYIIKLILLINN